MRAEIALHTYFDAVIVSCQEIPSLKKRYWNAQFENGLQIPLTDQDVLESIVLHPAQPINTIPVKTPTPVKNKRSVNIHGTIMEHLLDTRPVLKTVVDGKVKKSQQLPFCSLRQNCWSSMNMDGIKRQPETQGEQVESKKKDKRTPYFCRGCKDETGNFLPMCEMCYAFSHTSRGIWKLNASTTTEKTK